MQYDLEKAIACPPPLITGRFHGRHRRNVASIKKQDPLLNWCDRPTLQSFMSHVCRLGEESRLQAEQQAKIHEQIRERALQQMIENQKKNPPKKVPLPQPTISKPNNPQMKSNVKKVMRNGVLVTMTTNHLPPQSANTVSNHTTTTPPNQQDTGIGGGNILDDILARARASETVKQFNKEITAKPTPANKLNNESEKKCEINQSDDISESRTANEKAKKMMPKNRQKENNIFQLEETDKMFTSVENQHLPSNNHMDEGIESKSVVDYFSKAPDFEPSEVNNVEKSSPGTKAKKYNNGSEQHCVSPYTSNMTNTNSKEEKLPKYPGKINENSITDYNRESKNDVKKNESIILQTLNNLLSDDDDDDITNNSDDHSNHNDDSIENLVIAFEDDDENDSMSRKTNNNQNNSTLIQNTNFDGSLETVKIIKQTSYQKGCLKEMEMSTPKKTQSSKTEQNESKRLKNPFRQHCLSKTPRGNLSKQGVGRAAMKDVKESSDDTNKLRVNTRNKASIGNKSCYNENIKRERRSGLHDKTRKSPKNERSGTQMKRKHGEEDPNQNSPSTHEQYSGRLTRSMTTPQKQHNNGVISDDDDDDIPLCEISKRTKVVPKSTIMENNVKMLDHSQTPSLLAMVQDMAMDITVSDTVKSKESETKSTLRRCGKKKKKKATPWFLRQLEIQKQTQRKTSIPPKKRVCEFYLQARCTNGDSCGFEHQKIKEVCSYYVSRGSCDKMIMGMCPKMHGEFPCMYFHKRDYCSKNDCLFSHDEVTEDMRPVLDDYYDNYYKRREELSFNRNNMTTNNNIDPLQDQQSTFQSPNKVTWNATMKSPSSTTSANMITEDHTADTGNNKFLAPGTLVGSPRVRRLCSLSSYKPQILPKFAAAATTSTTKESTSTTAPDNQTVIQQTSTNITKYVPGMFTEK